MVLWFDVATNPRQVRDRVRVLFWLSPPTRMYKLNVDASVFKGGLQIVLCLGIFSLKLEIMNVIKDIRLLLSDFPSYFIAYIPRSCNSVAHEVAKFTLVASVSIVWEDSFPS
ncbi:hypothetical protein ACOSP7_020953 [Xanthoceras sorbifolium]